MDGRTFTANDVRSKKYMIPVRRKLNDSNRLIRHDSAVTTHIFGHIYILAGKAFPLCWSHDVEYRHFQLPAPEQATRQAK